MDHERRVHPDERPRGPSWQGRPRPGDPHGRPADGLGRGEADHQGDPITRLTPCSRDDQRCEIFKFSGLPEHLFGTFLIFHLFLMDFTAIS